MNYYLGEIIAFAGPYLPENFMLCNGASLPVNGNEALYSVIGNIYGGSGSSFNLPNLQGIVVVGTGTSNQGTAYTVGKTGGATQVTLTEAQVPNHTHAFNATTNAANTPNPVNALLATANATGYPAGASAPYPYSKMPASKPPVSGLLNQASLTMVGSGLPHNNQQPYLTINYIICVNGEYPTFP